MNEKDNKQLDLSVGVLCISFSSHQYDYKSILIPIQSLVQHHLKKGHSGFRQKKQSHFKDKKAECCVICGIGFE
ncbi:unnamed protein product [Paramecium sonneborni]|uniref:Uncharacterized protein n=1 Tax=Paramecium sonneborni TaxID=65129 RepID=A0A8S1Q0P5_9CILI|nr:unnamed protein product [Paramecium sonneborni]